MINYDPETLYATKRDDNGCSIYTVVAGLPNETGRAHIATFLYKSDAEFFIYSRKQFAK